jgi:hypothetical protein
MLSVYGTFSKNISPVIFLTAVGSCFHNCQLKSKNKLALGYIEELSRVRDGQILKKISALSI